MVCIQGRAQGLDKGAIHARFVPDPQVIDVQLMGLSSAFEKTHQVIRAGLRIGRADPARKIPGQRQQLDVGIAALGLPHEPPFIAAIEIGHTRLAHVRGFATLGRVGIAPDLNLEHLQGGPVMRLEQVVEDLAALRLGIVDQQPGSGAAAAGGADAIEHFAGRSTVDHYLLRRRRRRGGCGQRQGC